MHIVIFTGGECPEPSLTEAYFSSRKPDFVIAADSGILSLEQYDAHFGGIFTHGGNAPDAILGDMDSLSGKGAKDALKKYPAERIQRFVEDKDYTDTELALDYAHKIVAGKGISTETNARKKADAHWITLVGAGGGTRVDHFLGVFDLFATDLRPDAWLCGEQALWYAPQGMVFSVDGLELRDMVSVARTSAARTGGSVASDGLLWESGLFRAEGMPSISNRIKPAFFDAQKPVTIEVREGEFVLILPTKAKVSVHAHNAQGI